VTALRASLFVPAPGLLLLRLAAGGQAGWAAGAGTAEAAHGALVALARRDPAELALGLPEEGSAVDPARGLVAMAALDLLARQEGVPAAMLLGGTAGNVPLAPPPGDPLPAGMVRLPGDPAALRAALLDPATLMIVAEPVAAGGPPGLRRLAAAARAFQVEVALLPVPHPAAVAAAAHLRAGIPWLGSRPVLADAAWRPDPERPGFGWAPPGEAG